MAILSYDLNIDQDADSTSYSWTLYPPGTPVPVPTGTTPTNLTGASARMMIRTHPLDPTPPVSISTTPNAQGQLTLGGVAGTVAMTVLKAATALLVGTKGAVTSRYLYDIFVDFPGVPPGSVAIVSGNVNVRLAITH